MKKGLLVLLFALSLLSVLALGVFASEAEISAAKASDITDAIASATEGDVINISLAADIEVSEDIKIDAAITVNVSFNGYQIAYSGGSKSDNGRGCFVLNNTGAILTLNGSNKLADYSQYTHYSEAVKPDMTGSGNLICVRYGQLYVKNAYMYAPSSFAIYGAITKAAEYEISVEDSVLRADTSVNSAICFRGSSDGSYYTSVESRALKLSNCVEYGGFFGNDYNFNLTRGTEFTNVKFYDFYIVNDCWYQSDSLGDKLMVDYENAFNVTGCIFNTTAEEKGSIKVNTATGKQNFKLIDCEFESIVAEKIAGDTNCPSRVYIIHSLPSCKQAGLMSYYECYKGGSLGFYENEAIEKLPHTLCEAVITYPLGYDQYGESAVVCSVCKEADIVPTQPIFNDLGYSANLEGTSITLGTQLNQDALDNFLAYSNGVSLEFGFLAGTEKTVVSVENGVMSVTGGIAVKCNEYKGEIYNLKVININTEERKLAEFAMEFYMFDGSTLGYTDGIFDVKSYYDIVEIIKFQNGVLDDFEKESSTFVAEGYDNNKLSGTFTAQIVSDKGEDGSCALELVRSSSGNSEMNIILAEGKQQALGDNKYLVVWVDFTSVDFRKACFGLLSGSDVYRTDDGQGPYTAFYYLAQGESQWVEMKHGNDGCFGSDQASSMIGKKGYLALPTAYFYKGNTAITADVLVTGIYFYCDVNNGQGNAFYLDSFMIVEDYTTLAE